MNDSLLIKNTSLYYNIYDTTTHDILVAGGKIICIAPSGQITQTGAGIDATGCVAIPGLIDLHIHGAGGSDSLDGTAEAMETISRTLARLGTTGFLSTMVMRPGGDNRHLKVTAGCTGKNLGGAVLLGIYLEGPFINNTKKGGIVPESITGSSPALLDQIIEETGDSLRMMCVAPEIPGIAPVIDRLRTNNIKVAFGHSDADYAQTREGFNMGINHVTHLFNAMRPLHHRDPGPLAAIFENPDITVELIGDTHHVHPGLFKMVWNLKGHRSISCITDGISGMGLPEGTYMYNNRKYTSKNGLARYLDGTFIGSTTDLLKIVTTFKSFTDCTFRDAIDTVTINPARVLCIDNQKGSLEPGKDADIVLLDSCHEVKYTIITGRTVYRKPN
jgi:N-acetylglucosamine-6-phosphate deacetylase